MKEEIKNNLKILIEISQETKLIFSGDTLLTMAVKLYREEEARKNRTNNIPSKPQEELATEKQIYRLKQMGVNISKGLTKSEAFKLIKENMELI
jgi:hypothetical protein